jgi:NAD(P)-dependent dehydrogenase (short-subunit alcohol dehydrogenase family)
MTMSHSLADRVAIVTGGSRGLGLEVARAYLKQGASVLATARDESALTQSAEELRSAGGQIAAVPADVSVPEDCARVVREAEERFGPVSVLVNNAGVYGPMGGIEDVDWPEWTRAIEINLYGPVLMCRAVLPGMRARGYGKIVNLSGGGATAPLPNISAYAASKAAIVRLTETFAEELRGTGVDVNAIAPGALNTRMLDQVLEAGPEAVGKDFYAKALKQRDSGGAGLERGAELALFLGSPASDGISGRLLSALWDDWANLPEQREELMAGDVYTLRRIVPEDRDGR